MILPHANGAAEAKPSCDNDAERGVCGAVMLDPSRWPDVAKIVRPEHFNDPDVGSLFRIVGDLIREGATPDSLAAGMLSRTRGHANVNATLIADVMGCSPTAANAVHYAEKVREHYQRRCAAMMLFDAQQQLQRGLPVDQVLRELDAGRYDLDREAGFERPEPTDIATLTADHPHQSEEIIHGWLRRGETANIIAPPKIGKSWLTYIIALTVATGGSLFGRFLCRRGRVLIVDNELFAATICHRIGTSAKALELRPEGYGDSLDVLSLRGRLMDIYGIADVLSSIPKGEYDLVVLDALYRAEPEGQTENDNSARMRLYNLIDGIAARMGCAWLNVHHSSKGDQSGKSVTDVGAGAGSQARAADAHIILRPHEEQGVYVLEAAIRSFAPVEPVALRWEFPLWIATDTVDPSRLKGKLSPKEQQQSEADQRDLAKILAALQEESKTESQLRAIIGSGRDRTQRLLAKLEADNLIQSGKRKVNGGKARVYRLSKVPE